MNHKFSNPFLLQNHQLPLTCPGVPQEPICGYQNDLVKGVLNPIKN